MPNTREIKRRIKSVSNIRQITKAMQLVATSKMKRAQNLSVNADAYAYGALEILINLTKAGAEIVNHHFWKDNGNNRNVLIFITTDRGFCGGLNVNLAGSVLKFVKDNNVSDVITVGKKGRGLMKKMGLNIIADFSNLEDHFSVKEISPIIYLAINEFNAGNYGRVFVAFSEFVNILVQKPTVRQILPVSLESFESIIETNPKAKKLFFEKNQTGRDNPQYFFEPSLTVVFEKLIPHLLEIEFYKALLDARAAEHSARMVAMKNATDKAGDLIDDLKLTYNEARQSLITKEIAEISTGAMATG